MNGVYFAVIVELMFSFAPKDRIYDRGGGGDRCLCRRPSPELQSFRPYILVLPPGGEVDLIDFCISGVNSSVSAAITLHSGDEWVFCVPWHQQYSRSGRGVNFFLGRFDSSSEVVSSSDFRFDRFDFLFRFERFFLSFFT